MIFRKQCMAKGIKTIRFLEAVLILFVFCSCASHEIGKNIIESNLSNESANADVSISGNNIMSSDDDLYQIELHRKQIGRVRYGTGSEGGTNLENGITFLFAVFDDENSTEISWIKSWNNIEISELNYYSGVSVAEDKLIMAVNGILYSLYVENGGVEWQLDSIGYPFKPPIIDKSGKIYLVSEKEPYLSIINKNGIIESQLYSDQLYGIQDLYFENDLLIAKIYSDTYTELIIENTDDFKE